jgi:hypothetical protein
MLPDHDEWDDGAAVEPQLGELLGRYVYGLDSVWLLLLRLVFLS